MKEIRVGEADFLRIYKATIMLLHEEGGVAVILGQGKKCMLGAYLVESLWDEGLLLKRFHEIHNKVMPDGNRVLEYEGVIIARKEAIANKVRELDSL